MKTIRIPGLVIQDIAYNLVNLTTIELESYSYGLALVPKSFGVGDPYGKINRPGILHINPDEFDGIANKLQDRFLNDPDYPNELYNSFWSTAKYLKKAYLNLEDKLDCQKALNEVWERFNNLMAFTAFNWVVPIDQIKCSIADMCNLPKTQLEQWYNYVCLPSRTPHFLEYQIELFKLLIDYFNTDKPDYTAFSINYGCLQDMSFRKLPMEYPDNVKKNVEKMSKQLKNVETVRLLLNKSWQALEKSELQRKQAITAMFLRCYANSRRSSKIQAYTKLFGLMSDAEEERHVLQRKIIKLFRLVAKDKGIDSEDISSATLDLKPIRQIDSFQRVWW